MEDKVKNDNQAAPLKEDNASEAVSKTTETASTVDVSKETATNTQPTVQAFDAQKTYEGLQQELTKVTKSYSELRREFSRRTAHESDLQKKLDAMMSTLAKATETPIDPEQFIRDLQTQGPKALEPHFSKWAQPLKDNYDKAISEKDARINNLEVNLAIRDRRSDDKNYPGFAELEPIMNELANEDNCPVNWNMGINECLDALYKLAKDRSSEQAIQEAVKIGEKKAEDKLVKEAKTATTGGGKSSGNAVPDLNKVDDVAKLREIVSQLHGVADRD